MEVFKPESELAVDRGWSRPSSFPPTKFTMADTLLADLNDISGKTFDFVVVGEYYPGLIEYMF